LRSGVDEPLEYKVVETSEVTEDSLEKIMNDWTRQGWRFESLHFAMRESSRRPAMAFLYFVRKRQGN
jgi:hypothetical protein